MGMRIRLILALVFASSIAFAQGDAEAEAKAAMKRGLAAFARRDAETALMEYRKAVKLVPDANVPHRFAAEALVELGRYDEAIEEYEAYLKIKPDVSDAGDIRARIEKVHAKLDGTVDLTSSPSGATVFIDGSTTKSGVTPLHGLRLKRGSHTIVLQLAGRKDVTLTANVKPSESSALVANFAEPGETPKEQPSTPPSPSSMVPTLGWIALGLGAAGLGTGLVLDGIVLPSTFDTFEEKRRADDPSASDTLASARSLQTATLVSYVAGGVLAATGIVLLLLPKKTAVKVGTGVYLTGSF